MKYYNTLSEAINDLMKRGYIYDFNAKPHSEDCPSSRLKLQPSDFTVDEIYRIEGMSSTDDNSVVYAISSKDGIMGILVDAYGVYSENIFEEMRKYL